MKNHSHVWLPFTTSVLDTCLKISCKMKTITTPLLVWNK